MLNADDLKILIPKVNITATLMAINNTYRFTFNLKYLNANKVIIRDKGYKIDMINLEKIILFND
tara:strand:+ start:507 stop:698 length:192 start_codon:yes stop_codon:yes gene_type:complete